MLKDRRSFLACIAVIPLVATRSRKPEIKTLHCGIYEVTGTANQLTQYQAAYMTKLFGDVYKPGGKLLFRSPPDERGRYTSTFAADSEAGRVATEYAKKVCGIS